jgi:MIP family channel proteins
MSNSLARPLVAEFIGTFALIFIGAGAAIALGVNHDPPVAFAHGLTILAFVAAFGDISGGHFNPGVTIGLATAGAFPIRRVAPYIVVQLAGAIVAAWVLFQAYGGPVNNLGATLVDTQRISYGGAFMFEAVGTAFLVTTVLHTAVRSPSRLAPVAIGLTITLCILGFGIVTGGAVNPARTIGPDVVAGLYGEIPLYVAAQLVGAIGAGVLYRWFRLRRGATVEAAAAQGAAAE